MKDSPTHGQEGRGGEDGEERIVEEDEVPEDGRSRNGPWLVGSLSVVCVQAEDCDDIYGGEGEWDPRLQGDVVEVFIDGDGCSEGSFVEGRWQCLGPVLGKQAVPGEGEDGLGDVHLRSRSSRHVAAATSKWNANANGNGNRGREGEEMCCYVDDSMMCGCVDGGWWMPPTKMQCPVVCSAPGNKTRRVTTM